MKSKIFKLTIDLVPETCWYSSLYRYMPRSKWDKLRKQVFAQAGYACQICGVKGKLNCHELWEYDDKKLIQKLKGFIAICSMCHHVKHFGLSQILAEKGRLNLDTIIDHFCIVNKVSHEVFNEHKRQSFDIWRERSTHQWTTDFGPWIDFITPKVQKQNGMGKPDNRSLR